MSLRLSEALGQLTSYTEQRVKNVRHIVGSIGYTTHVGILLIRAVMSQLPAKSTGHAVKADLS